MTAINPGIHNLSDAELQGRLDNITAKLDSSKHSHGLLAGGAPGCPRCVQLRAASQVFEEQRHRAETGS